MDTPSERYALNVADAVAAVLGPHLAGVYLHGSAVLGGFDARRSDVDVLVVCDGLPDVQRSATVEALSERWSERRMPCPARGLELSVVTLPVAHYPTADPAFELHVGTGREGTTVVDGRQHGGDPDLVRSHAGPAGRHATRPRHSSAPHRPLDVTPMRAPRERSRAWCVVVPVG